MPPPQKRDPSDRIELTVREWAALMETVEFNTRENQKNHDDIIVMKTKMAFVGIISGLIASLVTSILGSLLVSGLLYLMRK